MTGKPLHGSFLLQCQFLAVLCLSDTPKQLILNGWY